MNENHRWLAVGQLAALLVCATALGCAGSESGEQTFYIGWTILGLICFGMLVLVGGFIRYIRQGAKRVPQGVPPETEYEYHPTDGSDDDDPFRQP